MTPRPRPPVPSSVSEAAQQSLAGPSMFGDVLAAPSIDDEDGWVQFIESRDGMLRERIAARMPDDLPIDRVALELDGVTTWVLRPHHIADTAPIYLDLHGGALILGGGDLCPLMATGLAMARPMITWAVDYRMPPRHPYPAALDDCVAAYRRALEERPPEEVVVGGTSAGGNLAAALLLRARAEGLPMPSALVLQSPEVDLTESGDSFQTNLGIDHVLGSLLDINRMYAGGEDLAQSLLSPLFGDVSGFPPTLLQTGTRDLFLSNTVRMHRALREAGVDAELHVWEAMPHGGFFGAPEDLEVVVEVNRFIGRYCAFS